MITNTSVCLLLEDEPLIAMDLEQTLGSGGFSVTTVTSCAEAIDWLGMLRPDIAVVNVELRDGPCDTVVERLVENSVPFIVHSGGHPSQYTGTPFARGKWLSKPAGGDELVAAARALLSPS